MKELVFIRNVFDWGTIFIKENVFLAQPGYEVSINGKRKLKKWTAWSIDDRTHKHSENLEFPSLEKVLEYFSERLGVNVRLETERERLARQ